MDAGFVDGLLTLLFAGISETLPTPEVELKVKLGFEQRGMALMQSALMLDCALIDKQLKKLKTHANIKIGRAHV